MERAQPTAGSTTQQGRAGSPRGPAQGGPGEPGGGLAVRVHTRPGGVVVALDGELDHGTVEQLDPVLEGVRILGADRVVLDCSRLEFFDSSGLRLLLRGRRLAEAAGGSLEIAEPKPMLELTLRLTGVWDLFPVHRSLEDAWLNG